MKSMNVQPVCRIMLRSIAAPRSQAGFTLIELLIVVAIVAILSAVAYASYNEAVWKSHRRNGAACAIQAAQFMERFYTTNLRYNLTLAGAAVALPNLTCAADAQYTLTLTNVTPTTYTVNATPTVGTPQANRDNGRCAVLRIDQANVKTTTGGDGVAVCWE